VLLKHFGEGKIEGKVEGAGDDENYISSYWASLKKRKDIGICRR